MPSPLTFIPLGGADEIGMNFNVYGHDQRWLLVDCGIGFERTEPGQTEVWLPDPTFVANQRDAIVGLVITHVHLDHLGAVADLWPRLRCPIYCTPFAATFLRRKLQEVGLGTQQVRIHERVPGARWQVGPFDLTYVRLTHSCVEMCGLAIRTPAASVFHTGDFKLDPEPVTGPPTDLEAIRRFGDEGVDVVVSDSTNATKTGRSRSEGDVHRHLEDLIGGRRGRIAVGLFSSNVARIEALIRIAEKHERHAVLVGRSLERMVHVAHAAGYLRGLPPTHLARDAAWLPRDRVLYLCTGTQAEPGSAIPRIAHDGHRWVMLDEGDTVIFSSKIIPGNEAPIGRLHETLRARGIEVIHEGEDPGVHASGHPCRDELAALYEAVRPGVVVPVHGTPRHTAAHADWAEQLGFPAHEVRNGDVTHLGPGPVRKVGTVPSGRFPQDAMRDTRPRRRR